MRLHHRHRKTLAYLLLALFSLPGVGFSATVHYCNGHLSGLSLLGPSESCHDQTVDSCHNTVSKKSCCASTEHDSNNCCQDTDSFNVLDYNGTSQSHDMGVDYEMCNVTFYQPTKLFVNYKIYSYDPIYPQPPPLSGYEKRIKLGSFLC